MMTGAVNAGGCASLADCYPAVRVGVVALVCLSVLIGVMLGVTLVTSGRRLPGSQEHAWCERLLGIVPDGRLETADELGEVEVPRPRRRPGSHRATSTHG